MPRPKSNRQEELANVSARVVYQQGFSATTLSDIAEAAAVPLGSIYYYFKSKDDVGAAVVAALSAQYADLQSRWDASGDPRSSLIAFVEMTVGNAETLSRYGCPIGSLAAELGKQNQALADEHAKIFQTTLKWMSGHFQALGAPPEKADAQGLELLSALEGASLLAHMFSSQDPIERVGKRLISWLSSLGNHTVTEENEDA